MNLIPSWLSTLRARQLPRRQEPDLGDMGTTFGLEAAMPSLNEVSRLELQARRTEDPAMPWQDRPTRPARL
jgi:hypothetical protein